VSESLRILHLIDKNLLTTGSVVQTLQAARGLAGRGHEVSVGSRAGGDLESACDEAGLRFLQLPFHGAFDPVSIAPLRRFLRHHRIQIVHAHKGRAHAASLIAAARLGRLPRLVVNRGVSFPLDLFNRWKYRHPRVGSIVCVADAVAKIVMRTGGVECTKVHTIYGGTDCNAFEPGRSDGVRARNELNLGRHDLIVGQISVRDWKGWSDLVAAFARIAPAFPGGRLLLVGCEPEGERRRVLAAARGAGVAESVLTMPFRRDMPEVIAACDVVVDASYAGTGITGTIREAMAMARAVVATDCGGNRELVTDGEVGLLVPPRDVDALAGALRRLLEEQDLRQRLGAAARRRVLDHFTTEQRIEKLEVLYRWILADSLGASSR
jgi:glycosyltransferase involved in cell wall biosynthesis